MRPYALKSLEWILAEYDKLADLIASGKEIISAGASDSNVAEQVVISPQDRMDLLAQELFARDSDTYGHLLPASVCLVTFS